MIPDRNRQEWHDLLSGRKNYELKNLVLQLRVEQAKRDIQSAKCTVKDAINEIYDLCVKYELAVINDMKIIFGDYKR